MDTILEFLKSCFDFKSVSFWACISLAVILLYILYRRKEAKKYEITVKGPHAEVTDSAKRFWEGYKNCLFQEYPKIYLRLVQLDYKELSVLNLELREWMVKLLNRDDYLDDLNKIKEKNFV